MTQLPLTADQRAFAYLKGVGIFFDNSETPLCVNLNDTFAWGCADGEDVPEDQAAELERLHRAYGDCGVLYWASERRGLERSEFADINRKIDFVRNEERIRRDVPDGKRAYHKEQYTLGEAA